MARGPNVLPPVSPLSAPRPRRGRHRRTSGIAAPVRTVKVQLRIDRVRQELARGLPIRTIVARLAEEFHATPRAVRSWVEMAYRDAAADAGLCDVLARRAQLREIMEETYQLAMDRGDLKSATVLLDRMAKLEGCYAPVRVEMTGEAPVVIGPGNPEATRKRIRELLRNTDIQTMLASGTQ